MTNAKGEVWTAALRGGNWNNGTNSVASYTGWLGWCDGHGLYEKYIERTVKRLGGSE